MAQLLEANCQEVGYRATYQPVIKNIHFSIEAQDSLMMLGNNGSGKSTLLKAIALDPQVFVKGEIRLNGKKIGGHPQHLLKKGMLWIPQVGCSFEQLSVQENLLLFAATFGCKDLSPAIDTFPSLSVLLKKKPAHLSGGERRMVELSVIALMKNPILLLLDEPMAALSSENIDRFSKFLRENIIGRIAMIIVTHKASEVSVTKQIQL